MLIFNNICVKYTVLISETEVLLCNAQHSCKFTFWYILCILTVFKVFERADEHKEEDGVSQNDLDALINGLNPVGEMSSLGGKPVSGKWVCAQSSVAKIQNHNQHITDKLEVLAKAYTHQGDKWRVLGYSKAINALKSYHKSIDSYEVSH